MSDGQMHKMGYFLVKRRSTFGIQLRVFLDFQIIDNKSKIQKFLKHPKGIPQMIDILDPVRFTWDQSEELGRVALKGTTPKMDKIII